MSALTEQEIFSLMAQELKLGAECCDKLAMSPKQGPLFDALRKHLKTIEGCCRQAAHWREDTRWLPVGIEMEKAHQFARRWIVEHYSRKMFTLLAAKMLELHKIAVDLRDKAPPKLGLILPELQADPTPRNAHILMPPKPKRLKSGLIVPGTVH